MALLSTIVLAELELGNAFLQVFFIELKLGKKDMIEKPNVRFLELEILRVSFKHGNLF